MLLASISYQLPQFTIDDYCRSFDLFEFVIQVFGLAH